MKVNIPQDSVLEPHTWFYGQYVSNLCLPCSPLDSGIIAGEVMATQTSRRLLQTFSHTTGYGICRIFFFSFHGNPHLFPVQMFLAEHLKRIFSNFYFCVNSCHKKAYILLTLAWPKSSFGLFHTHILKKTSNELFWQSQYCATVSPCRHVFIK